MITNYAGYKLIYKTLDGDELRLMAGRDNYIGWFTVHDIVYL